MALKKSLTNKMLTGVCGGIAEHFGWDPTLVRVAFVVGTLLGGSGILLYLILFFLMPNF